ncbi:mucin-13b isoform X10 [Tachysurus fulvidraco]|uniref:mucin-13b isoform X9 n=1 Tax=Tachysurus fulvidraco TaxID=1234273 RepID=UPI001FEF54B6|nr:mucin-13b isoform X9 [Tachysurus fulvidraco]XP_047673828.1 mucin-13b isoform X10 [Tachysurus fulvidraco]
MALIKQLLSLYLLFLLVGGNVVLTITATSAPITNVTATSAPITTVTATSAPITNVTEQNTSASTIPVTGETTSTPTTPVTETATSTPTTHVTEQDTSASTIPVTEQDTSASTIPVTEEATSAPITPATGETTSAPSTLAPGETTSAPSTPAPGGTTPAPTTLAPGPCASNSCPFGSTCQELLHNYTCVCQPGLFYNEVQKVCYLAKTFPTELKLAESFQQGMEDQNSLIFKQTADEILNALQDAFKDIDYLGSTVLSLKKGSVIADVENFFSPTSEVTADTVKKHLSEAIKKPGVLLGANVMYDNICNKGYCHDESTNCDPGSGLASCTCRDGYIKITQTNQACAACPSGQKAVNQEECKLCAFGFSGFNCEDPYLLILVVVACVLGTLFLATLTGAIVLYTRSKKMTKSPEKIPANGNLEFTKPAGIPRIPRVNPNSGWQPTNLEMTDSGSRHALVTKDRTETTAMWNYDYPEDTRSYKTQTPSRTGYAATGAYDGSRVTRNPYYDAYDDKIRRY